MRRAVLAEPLASMIVLAGCSALPGGRSDDGRETTVGDEPVAVADDDPGATDVEDPAESGEDEVEIRPNGQQSDTGTVAIG